MTKEKERDSDSRLLQHHILIESAKKVYQRAVKDLGENLGFGGFSVIDLMADNFNISLNDCRTLAAIVQEEIKVN